MAEGRTIAERFPRILVERGRKKQAKLSRRKNRK